MKFFALCLSVNHSPLASAPAISTTADLKQLQTFEFSCANVY